MMPSVPIVVPTDSNRPIFDLVEMQGELQVLGAERSPQPSNLGTLIHTGKTCTLRMGSLALAGDVAPMKRPCLLVEKKQAVPNQHQQIQTSKLVRVSGRATPESDGVFFADWWAHHDQSTCTALAQTGRVPSSTHFSVAASVESKFTFKSKPTRHFD